MKNKYFPDEEIEMNDLYFVCYMIERVARHIKQKNKYVVNTIGRDGLYHLLSCANVLHCENPLKVEEDWIKDYNLKAGDYDVTAVDQELASIIPSPLDMGAVYQRLIRDTIGSKEDYVDGIMKHYAKKGFDGLVHVKSFGCTPEMDAVPVLHNISSDYKIPVLYLNYDTQTSDTGIETRLEAFYDMIAMRKEVTQS